MVVFLHLLHHLQGITYLDFGAFSNLYIHFIMA